ncbi:MAG TPA: Pls/PosA family non-ribosomal peptide synthetase [Tepidisphaeraceae bacterium]|nr:Pls/PosA family non-ribosomal peptide synthetase [Tepidisphaeraceae bacterium]
MTTVQSKATENDPMIVRAPGMREVRRLHELFETQADLRPSNVAVTCGSQSFSYAELDARANQLARHLRLLGLRPGGLAAIYLERSINPILAMLACLKAGGGYVPIDTTYPLERVRFVLANAGVSLVLTEQVLSAQASQAAEDFSGSTVLLDTDWGTIATQPTARLSPSECGASESDLCYVIYTSGTTGRPKGVMTEHRSVVHFVSSFNEVCGITDQDRIFQGFSPSFDGSVEEIWMAFAHGAGLVIGTADVVRVGSEVARVLNEHRVTVFSTVPTMLSTIDDKLPSVRLLIVSGERCPPELVNRWATPGRRLLNVYGPTETTVNATAAECVPDRPITIGRPLRGYEARVLDEARRPVPHGQKGELYIGGVGLARGYLNQPELSAETFVPNANGDADVYPRLYRTGDLVRFNADGELEFFGRIDGQVKIRGYRVELAEIEGVLLEHPQIRAAATRVFDRGTQQELVAYVTLKRPEEPLDRGAVLSLLRARVPHYMVPVYLDVLNTLPTLTSGKTDRARLPAPVEPLVQTDREIVAPRTEAERKTAAVWQRVLNISPISIDDNFFTDLGGHSLLAAQTVSLLRKEMDLDVAVRDVYRWPTIRDLAAQSARSADDGDDATRASETRGSSRAVFESLPRSTRATVYALQAAALYLIYGLTAGPMLIGIMIWMAVSQEYMSIGQAVLLSAVLLIGFYPALLLLGIAVKWAVIGRYKPGGHPVWGFYYFRWWLVARVQAVCNPALLAGTPLMSLYYRLMGAKVGRDCTIDTSHCFAFDLLSIGDETSICAETHLLGYRVEDGMLVFGRIDIGDRCFVGVHSALGLNARMGDDTRLGDLSLLDDDEVIPPGESRCGSPSTAAPVAVPDVPTTRLSRRRPVLLGLCHLLLIYALELFLLVTALPSAGVIMIGFMKGGLGWQIACTLAAAPIYVLSFCLLMAALRRIVLGSPKPGEYALESGLYLRKWFSDSLMALSRAAMLPLYTTIYLPPWMRLLGARIGARAELSTVWQVSPELLDAGDESFFADGTTIGRRHLFRGSIRVGINRIGRRTFVGNNALLPPGACLGDGCLLGVLSVPPAAPARTPDGSEWLGSPAFPLPSRHKVGGFDDAVTYRPSAKLYAQRLLVDAMRILVPFLLGIGGAIMFWLLLIVLHDRLGTFAMLALAPAAWFATSVAAAMCVVLMKLIVMGRFQPVIKPLWSPYVWLNEAVNGAYESVSTPALSPLLGTPFLAPYLRLLGCRIGRGVFLESILFSEFDLVRIDDYAALNLGAVPQTHLFEDRIMKSSHLRIGSECTVGNLSVVLYDTHMQRGARLAPLSLLMKGETLPPLSDWAGIPIGGRRRPLREPAGRHTGVAVAAEALPVP